MKRKPSALNLIASAVMTLAVVVVAAYFGDFYFDLNDDVLMKDILSGAYTGVPQGHNIQMLYPISAFIAFLYRVYGGLDWYGIFLCLCQFGCGFIVLCRILSKCEDKLVRIIAGMAALLFMLGGMLSHFVFVQYTFTCGLLSATAAFLIITHEGDKKADHVLAVFLIVLAYLIRSEMLLLTLPITGVAILIKFRMMRLSIKDHVNCGICYSRYGEKKCLFKKYVFLCLGILLGLVLSTIAHKVAYGSEDWKQFNDLFDARTELYDFQYIPDYEENAQFYDSIVLSEPEQQLLINYNFGIDEEINTATLRSVAEYAAKLRTDDTPFVTRLIRSIPLYFYRLRYVSFQKSYEYPMTDAPYNAILGILYLGAIILFVISGEKKKRLQYIFMLALLFACRSSLWLYIIVRGRDPIRITHPLYIMEIAVLSGMILSEYKNKSRAVIGAFIAICIAAAVFVPNQAKVITDEMKERDRMRAHYDALYDYFKDNPDSFYFVDVYTGVSATDGDEKSFSEKMFVNVDNSLYNHDLMGGWASKSPLYYKKIADAGFSSMQDAILSDDVYVVSKTVNDVKWLQDYYLDKGYNVDIRKVDVVADVFAVYKISEAG